MKPLFPYAGSSRLSAGWISELIRREKYDTYCEPFVGSGAIYFSLCPKRAYLNDANRHIVDIYRAVKKDPVAFIAEVEALPHDKEWFDATFPTAHEVADDFKRGVLMWKLMMLAYNGIMRIRGEGIRFSSYGTAGPRWAERWPKYRGRIVAASDVLKSSTITCDDYSQTKNLADMYFIDPPWVGSKDVYSGKFDHLRLASLLKTWRGKWVLTINDCQESRDLFLPLAEWYKRLDITYTVAPKATGRYKRQEWIITNFKPRMFIQ